MTTDKASKQLKDLLKPPFTLHDAGYVYDVENRIIFEIYPRRDFFHSAKNRDVLAKKLFELALSGFNNEWQRLFGEPMRWIYDGDWEYGINIICTKCKKTHTHFECDFSSCAPEPPPNHCPSCGQRLLPPGSEQDD